MNKDKGDKLLTICLYVLVVTIVLMCGAMLVYVIGTIFGLFVD